MFSQKNLVLVITPDSLLVVTLRKDPAAAMDSVRDDLREALEQQGISARDFWETSASLSSGLPRAYFTPRQVPADLRDRVGSIRSRLGFEKASWLRYATMTAAEIKTESPDSHNIAPDTILYVRGEDLVEGSGGEDLLVIRIQDREERYRLSVGCYYPARAALLSMIERTWQINSPGERIVSIVPACLEPGPKDFEFQYVFNLIFTDRRLILAVTPGGEDEVEQRWDAYMEGIGKKAKQQGISIEGYVTGSGLEDAPWQDFRTRSVPEILDADGVNFFIPYAHIREVMYQAGRKPKISLSLPSHTLNFEADAMFAPGPLRIAQVALKGIVPITL
jgi:hypothetical protein